MFSYFFDMDGVIFDSMPNHAAAWEIVMKRHGLQFTARDCYINEGRTGQDVIHEAVMRAEHREVGQEEMWAIYNEKTEMFHSLGGAEPIKDIDLVLDDLKNSPVPTQIWVVTGSGQQSLFDRLETSFPHTFQRERMVTAFDVTHGKPHPEPYLKAWERSGLDKSSCIVVENAPLGVKAGKAAGLFVVAVNTGVLSRTDLWEAGADIVLNNMQELHLFCQLHRYIYTHLLPQYNNFDGGHQPSHALYVINESLNLCRRLSLTDYPNLNPLMVYLIAAYHDIGLKIDRPLHHIHSGEIMRADERLKQWFTAEEIETMAQAVEDHRASRKEPPRSIYGCIVAEADRQIVCSTIIKRAVQFSLKNYPHLDKEGHIQRVSSHIIEKYGENGYLQLWLSTEKNERGLSDIRALIKTPDLLRAEIETTLNQSNS